MLVVSKAPSFWNLSSYSMSKRMKISDKSKDGQLAKYLVYSNQFDLFTVEYITSIDLCIISYIALKRKTDCLIPLIKERRFRIILYIYNRSKLCKLQCLFNFKIKYRRWFLSPFTESVKPVEIIGTKLALSIIYRGTEFTLLADKVIISNGKEFSFCARRDVERPFYRVESLARCKIA